MRAYLKNSRQVFYEEYRSNFVYFGKWCMFSVLAGLLGGVIGASFSKLIGLATAARQANPWLLLCMPLAGVVIVMLYKSFHAMGNKGTNIVLESVTSDAPIDKPVAPLIYVSTVLSHLVGASAGREGAALQIGGGLGDALGKVFRLDEKDKKIAVMAGMSAVFGAVFGTPIAASIFPIEVISVGIMHFSALVPCIFSAFIGYEISLMLGTGFEQFVILDMPAFDLRSALLIIVLGILCGFVAQLFCFVLHFADHVYGQYTKNSYVRILTASVIFIALTFLLRTDLYLGTSQRLLEEAFHGETPMFSFLWKMLFTAIALGGRFKGGEIVPTFCIGAAFGCMFGNLIGFSPSLCAACGMAALFVGVTNCPVSTLIISLEMLSMEAMPFYSLVIAVAFCFSGYTSLYSSQRIMYSKTRTEFINKR